MSFLTTPNLPVNKITHCLLSGLYSSVINDLHNQNVKTILVPFCDDVSLPIAHHADILCHHLGLQKILLYQYSDSLTFALESIGMQVLYSQKKLMSQYPNDIFLNAARVGKWIICQKDYTDVTILNQVSVEHIIHTRQGYAKCSTLIVDANSIITADKDIATNASLHGMDVLLIEQGYIRLDGFPYGFIGGCGVKLDQNTLYLTGQLTQHPDCQRMIEFLRKKSIEIVYGSSEALLDIGSIIPLKEQSAV